MDIRDVVAGAIGGASAIAVDRAVEQATPRFRTEAAAPAQPTRRTQLVAAGWIAHAGFDAAFRTDAAASRIPSWYPAMCAGYDVALGARLLLPVRRRPTVG